MVQTFINALAENLADILTIGGVIALVALGILFWRARDRHIARLKAALHGTIEVPSKIKEVLAKAVNADTAEIASIGTVTLLDIAWHYSMADPTIWDHFTGPAADHIADALQNLDVLKASLGDYSLPLAERVLETLRGLEATQLFNDLFEHTSHLGSAADAGGSVVLDGQGHGVIDTLSTAATAGKAAGLIGHIPLITIGFASYRAWRRASKGTTLGRNLEFAAIEVTTRAGGGLLGSQIGGAVGSFIVPGVGTIVGGVAGAVAGAIGGAVLGESIKTRHIRKAQSDLDKGLDQLGETYLADPPNYQRLRNVFVKQEAQYLGNLKAIRRKLRRYALLPWRSAWPNHKLVLLGETVRLAEERLGAIKLGTIEAVERLSLMKREKQYRQMGIILWSDPALSAQLNLDAELMGMIEQTNDRLRRELVQMGKQTAGAPA